MYDDLYKAWKAEKTSDKPQHLPNDFYQRASGYLKGLEDDSAASDTRTVQGSLLADEKRIAKRLFEELRHARLQKIVNAARDGSAIATESLTEEEAALVHQIKESLSVYREEKAQQNEAEPESPTELSVVRFLGDVPEIVGVDLKIYGPYKKEDVGSLPVQNAYALIKQGLAKEIAVKHALELIAEKGTETARSATTINTARTGT